MTEKESAFKKPPKKYQPQGLEILYEDRDIIVVDKSEGLLTIGTDNEKEHTAHFLLNNYVKKGNIKSNNRIFIVHRLDKDTSGVLVFAKSEEAKRYLQDNWHDFSKKYITIVNGHLEEKEGIIESYLKENVKFRVYSVKDPAEGKLAKTGYKVIKETEKYSLLEINLFTGRKNQIRVHLYEKGHPVLGDSVYGKKDKSIRRLALHSSSLTIRHPYSKKEMSFETELPRFFRMLMKERG